jgi:hypothetical protein
MPQIILVKICKRLIASKAIIGRQPPIFRGRWVRISVQLIGLLLSLLPLEATAQKSNLQPVLMQTSVAKSLDQKNEAQIPNANSEPYLVYLTNRLTNAEYALANVGTNEFERKHLESAIRSYLEQIDSFEARIEQLAKERRERQVALGLTNPPHEWTTEEIRTNGLNVGEAVAADRQTNAALWEKLAQSKRKKNPAEEAKSKRQLADYLIAKLAKIDGKNYNTNMSLEEILAIYTTRAPAVNGVIYSRRSIVMIALLAVLTLPPIIFGIYGFRKRKLQSE